MGVWVTEARSVEQEKRLKLQIWRCGMCGRQFILPKSPFEVDYYYCPTCGDPKNKEITLEDMNRSEERTTPYAN